jgi:hypothetical protein
LIAKLHQHTVDNLMHKRLLLHRLTSAIVNQDLALFEFDLTEVDLVKLPIVRTNLYLIRNTTDFYGFRNNNYRLLYRFQ